MHGQSAQSWLAEGEKQLQNLNLQEAKDAFSHVVDAGEIVAGQLGIARVYRAAGRWADVRDALDPVFEQDLANLDARYLRAIAYRQLALVGTPAQRRFSQRAREDFEAVLSVDSLYRDVLLQYARYLNQTGEPDSAYALGMEQIRLKPDLPNGKSGLIRLLRQIVTDMDRREALSWLQRQPGDYTSYMLGEYLRTHGDREEAERLYRILLGRPTALPRQYARLALARIYYADERPLSAQRQIDLAIEEISSAAEAAIIFQDFKYIFKDQELATYRSLEHPEAFRDFFTALWHRREPIPTSRLRVRLAEHYRRLLEAEEHHAYYGLRSWHLLPDNRMPFAFPAAYGLNREFNDRGLILIRYGPPDERIVTVGGMEDYFRSSTNMESTNDWLPYELRFQADRGTVESWRYEGPRVDFHFMRAAYENAWFLTPVVTGQKAFEDREHWGGTYVQMANVLRAYARRDEQMAASRVMAVAPQDVRDDTASSGQSSSLAPAQEAPTMPAARMPLMEIQDIQMRMLDKAQEDVTTVMTTDRHTWTEELERFEMPFLLATFRDSANMPRLEMHYALPIGKVSEPAGEWAHRVEVEVGLGVYDSTWAPVRESIETKNMPPSRDQTAALIDYMTLVAPPDSYSVAVHARPIEGNMLAGYKTAKRLMPFDAGRTSMSDLLPSCRIEPAADPSRFNRNGLNIRANPFQRFKRTDPVYIYFEAYNLTFDRNDRTQYSVEYRLRPKEEGRRFLGIFGRGDRPTLTLRFDREGGQISPVEWGEIDVSRVDTGAYVLEVTLEDRLTGVAVTRSIDLELTD